MDLYEVIDCSIPPTVAMTTKSVPQADNKLCKLHKRQQRRVIEYTVTSFTVPSTTLRPNYCHLCSGMDTSLVVSVV